MMARLKAIALVVLATACTRGHDLAVAPGPDDAPPVEPQGMKPMKKVEILVGGCRRDCADPGLAMAGFLSALATDPERAISFLDTTRLVVDGRNLGAEWAAMWKELRTATRKAAIRQAAESLLAWARDLPEDQVRSALAQGAKPMRVWSTEAEYEFTPPGRGPWRVLLRPRGLEWLVVEVQRTAENAHGHD